MTEKEVLEIFEKTGAIIQNSHIVYTSGKHGSAYINKDAIYPYTQFTLVLCREIGNHFLGENIEVVAAPAIGGVGLAQWVAYYMGPYAKSGVLAVYAEEEIKDGEKIRVFRRGYDKLIPGKRVLVVEDILTTGGSAKRVVDAVKKLNGEVIGLGVLCNRGGVKAEDIGVPELFALANIKMDAWTPNECPLCKEGVPINTEVGKGR